MSRHIKTILAGLFLAAIPAASAQEISFNDEQSDTTRITSILIEESHSNTPGNLSKIAEQFIGTPYASATLEHNPTETLTINLDSLDCTTFVETVLALAITADERRQSWHDFAYNLRRIRYRNGVTDGYTSRLHYVSDWIVDNVARGNVREITRELPNVRYAVKSLDFMTTHRDRYPALADSATYMRMRNVEAGFSNHRFPYIKAAGLNDKKLLEIIHPGDIIIFTTSTKGLDATHMGIATVVDGVPRLIHASSAAGKVLLDPLPLSTYLRRNRTEGIRIIRLKRN